MGWWQITPTGANEGTKATGLVWGDGPADVMDDALDTIVDKFLDEWGREPSMEELKAGLRFSRGRRR